MSLRRRGGLLAAASLAAVLVSTSAVPAVADPDPLAPVVVADSVTLWPGSAVDINVLANDSDPNGDELTVCWLPPIFSEADPDPDVTVHDRTVFGDHPRGTLSVAASPDAVGVHTVDYYVCNHSRLTPATLTVTIRPVSPVDVTAVKGRPGRIRVTNHNDRRILFLATDRAGCQLDVRAHVRAGSTRTFRVRRHAITWVAGIGNGIADRGVLRRIKLDRPPAPPSKPGRICIYDFSHGI